jgi:putative ABC transport system permease protein
VQLRSAAEESTRRLMPRLAVAGLAALAAGALFLVAPRGGLPGAFAGLFLVLLGGAALVPPALALLLALAGRLAGRAGLLLRLAARSLARSLSRTGVAVAALTLAVAVTVGVDLMIGSFRGAVVAWLDRTLAADLYVSSPDRLGGAAQGALAPAYVETLRALPGVRRLAVLSAQEVPSALGPLRVLALDLAGDADGRARASFTLLDGEARTVWAEVEAGAALVTEPLATRHRLARGARVRLHTDHGAREVTVAGVVRDYGSEAGALLLARPVYLGLWDAPEALAVSLTAEAGADLERLAGMARAAAPAGSAVRVESRRALREGSLAIFDRTFLVTSVLRLLTLAVAVVGVLSALLALALERGREIAVLRANGLTPRQLLRLVTLETTLMGAAAGLLAMPFGAALAAVMVHVINRRSFGWSMELVLAPRALLEGMAAATLAALLAGLYPAWRMARTSTAAALRDE